MDTLQKFINSFPQGCWTEHELLPDWKHEVTNDYTRLGFWEWLYHRTESEEHNAKRQQ